MITPTAITRTAARLLRPTMSARGAGCAAAPSEGAESVGTVADSDAAGAGATATGRPQDSQKRTPGISGDPQCSQDLVWLIENLLGGLDPPLLRQPSRYLVLLIVANTTSWAASSPIRRAMRGHQHHLRGFKSCAQYDSSRV